MTRLGKRALVGAISCAGICVAIVMGHAAAANDDQQVLDADQMLVQLLSKGTETTPQDLLVVRELLDKEFTWIDSNGRNFSTTQVLQEHLKPANAGVKSEVRTYGDSAIVRANRGKLNVLRVWTRRASGWRVVLYQEVKQVEKSEPPAAVESGSTECDNPCKTVPLQPETQSEKEAIASWQGVIQAMANNDAEAYAPLIADEFTATDTHHDRPYNKADRLAQLNKQKIAGTRSAPSALISGRMFDFGETVMMIAREQRRNAKPFFNSRMWVRRDGRWQMLFSFNTRVE